MKLKICIAKKTLIFYSIIAPFIIYGSAYNLIWGIILHKTPTIRLGAFSLLGFIIFPVLLIYTYINNKCIITADSMRIGKTEYKFADYDFQITSKELAFKDRPINSLFKKNYNYFLIQEMATDRIVFEKDLDVFEKDIEKIKNAFPVGKLTIDN
ncbi:hypothetical protein [Pedobacter nutrimenti]|uniref:hypothetical protein n=1 Tax=Pedobacter nutrimenti TaxID=1241337 RepID=UPI00292F0998|nr:hypothetical protein [Pedobacter nutrimenti]